MAQRNFRELGMDTMERLYYERKDARQKAYAARQKKLSMRKGVSAKRHQMEQDSRAFEKAVQEALYHDIEQVC